MTESDAESDVEDLEDLEEFWDAEEEVRGADEVGAGAPPNPEDPVDPSFASTQIGDASKMYCILWCVATLVRCDVPVASLVRCDVAGAL